MTDNVNGISRRDFVRRMIAGAGAAALLAGGGAQLAAPAEALAAQAGQGGGLAAGSLKAAASTTKCFTIATSSTPVYSSSALKTRTGWIYGDNKDEVTVLSFNSTWAYVRYPVSKGTKTGYIRTSAILASTSGYSFDARAKVTTYKRPAGASYGSIAAGDAVVVLGPASGYASRSGYYQVRYPVSGGYKYAWVKRADAEKSIITATVSGTYSLQTALKSSMVLDAADGKTANGTNLQIYAANGTAAQSFTVTHVSGGWHKIVGKGSGRAVDVAGGKSASGTNVQLYQSNGTAAQLWRFIPAPAGGYYVKNQLGCYLDVAGGKTANGTNVWAYSYNGSASQRWSLVAPAAGNAGNNTTTNNSSSNKAATFRMPVTNYYVCGNNWATYSAKCGGYNRHTHCGVDIKSRTGDTTVYSAAAGTVAGAGYDNANGNYVVVKHAISGKTVYSFYAHLKTRKVKSGAKVSAGTPIGVVGNTGSSSMGAHLHFAFASAYKPGSYYGYVSSFSGNKTTYNGVTYYNPVYVVNNGRLP